MNNFIKSTVVFGSRIANGLIDGINKLLSSTGINSVISFVAALPDNLINHTTFSHVNVMNNDYKITAPSHQDLTNTPTISQFLNASNTGYAISGQPDGLHPFKVNGRQLAIMDEVPGMGAKVWLNDKNQAIITFQGTGGR